MKVVKYYFQGVTVYFYCKIHQLSYKRCKNLILYYRKKYPQKDLNLIISMVIEIQFKKKKINDIKLLFHEIDQSKNFSLLQSTKILNISYFAVYKLMKLGFDKKTALYIIWFIGDKKTKSNKLSISNKQASKFLSFNNQVFCNKEINFMFNLALLKTGRNTLNSLIEIRTKDIKRIIIKQLDRFGLNIKENLDDLVQEISIFETGVYSRLILNNIPQNYKYLNIVSKFKVIELIKDILKNPPTIHLEDKINDDQTYYDIISRKGGYLW